MDDIDLLQLVEECTKCGYRIEYMSVNQISNGNEEQVLNGIIPLITYTVNVLEIDNEDVVYSESCDHIDECLRRGLEWVKMNNNNKLVKDNPYLEVSCG